MKITKDNEVYKSFKKLREIKEKVDNAKGNEEKIYWRGEYLRMDREFLSKQNGLSLKMRIP